MWKLYLAFLIIVCAPATILAQTQPTATVSAVPAVAQADFDAGQHAQAVEHDFPKAITLLTRAIDAEPGYAMAYGSRGATYFQMADYKHAAGDFSKALQLGLPPVMEARLYSFLGLTYRRLKQTNDAVRTYDAFLVKFGDNWTIYMQRGEAYQEDGDYSRAQSDFDKALALSPNNPDIIGRKMTSFVQAKDVVNALIENNKYLALRPNDANALQIHQALVQSGSYGKNSQNDAAIVDSTPLQSIINRLIVNDNKHGVQVRASIQSSHRLTQRLDALARSGLLKEIIILPIGSLNDPFGGAPVNGAIRLKVEVLDAAAGYLQNHNVDPIVFFLGYQSAKLNTQTDIDAEFKKQIAAIKPNKENAIDLTDISKRNLIAHANDDAKALITGWDDSFEAARMLVSAPLTNAEGIILIRNQPYADVLIKAMTRTGDQLKVPLSLIIEINEVNVNAISGVLLSPELNH